MQKPTMSNIITKERMNAACGVTEEPETLSLDEMLERGAAYGLQLDELIDPNHTAIDVFTPLHKTYRDPFELVVELERRLGGPLAVCSSTTVI